MIIGVTGPIGSGKTTVAKLFRRHWYNRIDADEIGHDILKKNYVTYAKIVKFFGNGILDKNKDINRKKLGDIVFDNEKKLEKLNSLTHPIIIKSIKNEISKIKKRCGGKTRMIIDAPLLLETKMENLVDKVVVVKCSKKNILKRLNKKYSKGKIEKILKRQMPLEEKLKHADFVVDNNKSIKHLEKQVERIIEMLK